MRTGAMNRRGLRGGLRASISASSFTEGSSEMQRLIIASDVLGRKSGLNRLAPWTRGGHGAAGAGRRSAPCAKRRVQIAAVHVGGRRFDRGLLPAELGPQLGDTCDAVHVEAALAMKTVLAVQENPVGGFG